MPTLHEEIHALEPCEKCEGCVRRAHVFAIIDRYAAMPRDNVSSRGEKRPAREKLRKWAQDDLNGDEPTFMLAIIEALDALADRLDRA